MFSHFALIKFNFFIYKYYHNYPKSLSIITLKGQETELREQSPFSCYPYLTSYLYVTLYRMPLSLILNIGNLSINNVSLHDKSYSICNVPSAKQNITMNMEYKFLYAQAHLQQILQFL